MRIGIIGAGHIGSTLTRRLTSLGHRVTVANSRGPETLAELAAETGATAGTAEDAVRDAQLVVVTIPEGRIPELEPELFDRRAYGAPIIDTCNYYPSRDGRIEAIESGMPESRWVEEQIGHPVIKVFNSIHARDLLELGKAAGSHGRLALPVAGDHQPAKHAVMNLVSDLGFDAVDVGTLDDSWRQEPGTPCYGKNLVAADLRRALRAAGRKRGGEDSHRPPSGPRRDEHRPGGRR